MAVQTIIPQSNVLLSDIRDTLNANGGSVGNSVTTFFGTSAKINPYSKHKPVKLAKDFCQDYDSTQPNYAADWWKGTDYWYGFKPITGGSDLGAIYRNGIKWEYNPPTGGTSSPFRVGDFRGYKPSAAPFFRSTMGRGWNAIVNKWTDMAESIYYNFRVWLNTDSYAIRLADLKGMSAIEMSNVKLCVMLYRSNPITVTTATSVKTYRSDVITSQEYVEFSIDLSGMDLGTYYALLGIEGGDNPKVYLPIPYDDDNYYMFTIELGNNPLGNIVASVSKIASYDYQMNTLESLQPLENFQPASSSKPFIVDGRGSVDVEFTLKNVGTNTETFWTSSRLFDYRIIHKNESATDSVWRGEVVSVNGQSYSGSSFNIASGGTATMVVRFGNGGEMYPAHYPDYESVVEHYITVQLGDVGLSAEVARFGLYIRDRYYS